MSQAAEAEWARRQRWGILSGLTMALGASLSFAAARAGIVGVLNEFFQHGYAGRIKRKNFANPNGEVDFLAARENGRQNKGY